MDYVNTCVPIIIISMAIFHSFGGYYVYKQKYSKAVFDRSKAILVMSNIFNVFEIGGNLTLGTCIINNSCSLKTTIALAVCSIFLSNCFYLTNILRAYRILVLANLEEGNFSTKSYSWIQTQLTWKWNTLLIIIGSSLLSIPYSSYIIYKYKHNPEVLDDKTMYSYFAGILIGFECFIFFFMVIGLYLKNIHPIIRAEFIFQLALWSSALFVLKHPIEQRLFFLIPIRNFLMIFITIICVYEHNSICKPPMPADIDLEFILQNQDFYLAFKGFLNKIHTNQSSEWRELLKILLEIRIFEGNNINIARMLNLKNKIINSNAVPQGVKSEFIKNFNVDTDSKEELFMEIDNYCYNILNDKPFNEFKNSEDMIEAQVHYSIS